jgi:hypothetical protein
MQYTYFTRQHRDTVHCTCCDIGVVAWLALEKEGLDASEKRKHFASAGNRNDTKFYVGLTVHNNQPDALFIELRCLYVFRVSTALR